MADVTAVYSMNDSDAIKALNRIEKRFDKHARETPAKMSKATDALNLGFIKSAITAAGAFKVIQTGWRFATDAVADYAKTSPIIAAELEKTSAAWDRFTRGIGRDLSLLTVNSSGPFDAALTKIESLRVKARDFYAGWYRFQASLVGITLGDGDPTAALIDAEADMARQDLARRRQEGKLGLIADFTEDPVRRAQIRADAAFEKEMRELNEIKINGQFATTQELGPLREQAALRRDLTVQREIDRVAEEARKKSEQEQTEARRTEAEAERTRVAEEKAITTAERSIDFLEKSATASQLRAKGLEDEADAVDILAAAERDLIDLRENEYLSAGSRQRGEAAIMASAAANLDRLGAGGASGAIGGASIGAGLGGSLSSRVFGVVGPSGNTDTRKIIDTAKAQLSELKGIREELRRPQLAVFAP